MQFNPVFSSFDPTPGLHFHWWSDRKTEQKDFSSSAWFLRYVRFWSCNTKLFQVLHSWVHKRIFFLETVGYFEHFKGIDFYILLFKTESYPTSLTCCVNYHQKRQIWESAVQMWEGHHITDQGEDKTVVPLLDFWVWNHSSLNEGLLVRKLYFSFHFIFHSLYSHLYVISKPPHWRKLTVSLKFKHSSGLNSALWKKPDIACLPTFALFLSKKLNRIEGFKAEW